MSRYRGSALIVQFINPAGTAQIQGPYTTFDDTRDVDLVDVSAGNDQDYEYILGLHKRTATLKFFDDTTQSATNGTALAAQFEDGTFGTVLYGPQGTAANLPKFGFPAFVKQMKYTMPFKNAFDLEVQFEKSGAPLFDFGAHW